VRFRALAAVAAALLLLAGCGDDASSRAPTASTVAGATAPPTTAGPTAGAAECARLARRYVRTVRVLFDRVGAPTDAQVDRARQRMSRFDTIAGAAGCGQAYTDEVCSGIDDLTHQRILVILPLTTAQCL